MLSAASSFRDAIARLSALIVISWELVPVPFFGRDDHGPCLIGEIKSSNAMQ
jgi:hypothetical protein